MSGDSRDLDRQSLLSKLLDAVKQCQIRFGGKTELATEDDSRVVCLCTQFENVLQHGIRKNSKGFLRIRPVSGVMKGLSLLSSESDAVFWHLIQTVLNKHDNDRYMHLRNINSDIGRGRAWLRSALNERSLERYMHMVLADVATISQFYEDWAFLMDEERSSVLPVMASGLGSILFAINIDNSDLNHFRSNSELSSEKNQTQTKYDTYEPEPVISKSIGNRQAGKKKKKRRNPTPHVISFDDNELSECQIRTQKTLSSSFSAPSTCLPSPISTYDSAAAFTFNGSPSKVQTSRTSNESSGITDIPDSIPKSHIPISSSVPSIPVSNLEDRNLSFPTPFPEDSIESISQFTTNCDTNILSEKNFKSDPTSSSLNFQNTDHSSHPRTILTPIDDDTVGELIPIGQSEDLPSSVEDSVSIPSFCDDVDNAVAALALAQRTPSWSISTNSSQGSRRGLQSKSRSETLTMTSEELRDALLTVMQRKEESENQKESLRSLLDREMEMNAALRSEMTELVKRHTEKLQKLEGKIQAVSRENELLKHQLRKYITAVQMLKHDNSKIDELNVNVEEIQPPIPEAKFHIDHQHEASEYEKKLVQVAEMHGELMEFNDRLHRLLLQKEAMIRRLKEELIDLRGPLPEDNQTSDDEVSITSDYDASSQTTPLRPLINVWIPSAFLTGRAANSHHVYQVYVRVRDDEWNVYRRYSQFYALHKILKKKDPFIGTFDFPPKKTIGKKDAKIVEQRRKRLQHYLRCILNWLLQNNSELANSPDKETIISLMPFLGEQKFESKNYSEPQKPSGRSHVPNMSSSPNNQQLSAQRYTGL